MNISEFIKEFSAGDIIAVAIHAVGVVVLCVWLVRTVFGRRALVDSLFRRNNMPVYLPLLPLFVWFVGISVAFLIFEKAVGELEDWREVVVNNIIMLIWGIFTIGLMVFLLRASFARRLKGVGLNVRTIGKDFCAAVLNFVCAWPVIMAVLLLTIYLGECIWGADFEMAKHSELESIVAHSQVSVRVMIFVVAVVIGPVLEEMLFRGMFQTMVRSFLPGPWVAIILSSFLFSMMHINAGHWPALFVLSVFMGYSYEKSGSLFRPIFIHAIFNGFNLIAVLNQ